jgi:GAF domain-containing protein
VRQRQPLRGADKIGRAVGALLDRREVAKHFRITITDFGPCGTVVDQNVAIVCSDPELDFPNWTSIKLVLEEGLLMPFYIKGEAVGAIWVVARDPTRRFDAEDLRVMTSLSTFAAAAYR